MRVLEVKNLSKSFITKDLEVDVLKDVSFNVEEGEFVLITGPSGSGKTTLLNVISGLEPITSGEVVINNILLSKAKNKELSILRQNKIGFVFQAYNLIPDLNVFENIKIANVIGKVNNDKKIDDLLKKFNLYKYRNYFPSKLSGGMQQRVAIIRSIINNPDIIFADEPTGNLDSKSSNEVMEMFLKLNKDYNKTIIMVTHSLDNLKYGTRNIQIVDGVISKDNKLC